MYMKTKTTSAFTLIEMLVVIAIIAVLAAFAVPALTSALTKGQMTGTVNNSRQFYLAAYQMALDGSTNSDPNLTWPGDDANAATLTLAQYCSKLVTNDYLKVGDLQKLLNAPGTNCAVTSSVAAGPPSVTTVTLTGAAALKVFKVKDVDSSNTVFAETANYTYNSAMDPAKNPFGDKGFVVQRKGGDASILRKNNVKAVSGSESVFQSTTGKQTGDADGTVTAETAANVLP
jgi:prepilin-type N-terminal cleavage/methylation domain-containing protein